MCFDCAVLSEEENRNEARGMRADLGEQEEFQMFRKQLKRFRPFRTNEIQLNCLRITKHRQGVEFASFGDSEWKFVCVGPKVFLLVSSCLHERRYLGYLYFISICTFVGRYPANGDVLGTSNM